MRIFGEHCRTTKSSLGWCVLFGGEPHDVYVLPLIPHVIWVHVQGLTSLGPNQYTGVVSIQAWEHPICETRFGQNYKTTKPSSCWCICYTKKHRSCMWYHPLHMSCWFIYMVWQALDPINILRSCLSKPQSTQTSCRTRFDDNCKATRPSSGWCMLLHEEPLVVGHGHVSTPSMCMCKVWQAWDTINTLGSYSAKPQSTQADCGTRFDKNCSTIMPSSGWCMLLYEEIHDTDVLPPIQHDL